VTPYVPPVRGSDGRHIRTPVKAGGLVFIYGARRFPDGQIAQPNLIEASDFGVIVTFLRKDSVLLASFFCPLPTTAPLFLEFSVELLTISQTFRRQKEHAIC